MYCCSNRVEFAGQMPPFDEWGLRPVGLEGPHEISRRATSSYLGPSVDSECLTPARRARRKIGGGDERAGLAP